MNRTDDSVFSGITGMVSSLVESKGIDLREMAGRTKVLSGYSRRKSFSPVQLLSLLLMWVTNGCTLRELASVVTVECGFPLTDTGLLARFRKCAAFLEEICKAMLAPPAEPLSDGVRLYMVDASNIRGWTRRSQSRLHQALVCEVDGGGRLSVRAGDFEVTRTKGKGVGEKLDRDCYHYGKGDIAVADRGYYCARGIIHAHDCGADVIVRFQSCGSPVWIRTGGRMEKANLLAMIRDLGLGRGEAGELAGAACLKSGKGALPVRVCVRRKTELEAACAKTRLDRYAANHHRAASGKDRAVADATYEYCEYIVVVTTLPADRYTPDAVLRLYRLRWQVELLFKRMKSIGEVRRLPVWNDESCQVYLLAKKLLFMLMDADGSLPAAMPGGDSTPWGEEICADEVDMEDDFLWEDFRNRYRGVETRLYYRIPHSKLPEFKRLKKLQHNRERRRKRLRSLKMYRMSCQRAV